jgi:c-di-GMP-binding flagellar brake protein YcgR
MAQFAERRRYQRCSSNICKVLLSRDGKQWETTELRDISAGGLRIISGKAYDINDKLLVNLSIYNLLSEFSMNFEALILRRDMRNGSFTYALKFVNVDKYFQVQLDEIVKAKLSLRSSSKPALEDGIYTFLLSPRIRPARMHLRTRL